MNDFKTSKILKFKIENIAFVVTLDETFESSGKGSNKPDFIIPHYHAVREIFFVGDMPFEIFTENESFSFNNCALSVPPFLKHSSRRNKDYRILLSCENQNNSNSDFSMFINRLYSTSEITKYTIEPSLLVYAGELANILKSDDSVSAEMAISLLKLMLYSLYSSNAENKCLKKSSLNDSYLIKIDKIIFEFQRDINLKYVSEVLGLSTRQTSRIIKKHYKIPLSELVLLQRLNFSRILLLNSDLTIAQIAEKANFPSESYFYSKFKKHFGTTPLKYKKANS